MIRETSIIYSVGKKCQSRQEKSGYSNLFCLLKNYIYIYIYIYIYMYQSLQMVIAAMKLKDAYSLEGKL